MLSLRSERCEGRRFRSRSAGPERRQLRWIICQAAQEMVLRAKRPPSTHPASRWTRSSAVHSAGVSREINRNLRNPGSRGFHDECLAVAFCANRQQGDDGIALDLRFDKLVDVL